MAYQNFYSESDNGKRRRPATCSGKEVTCDFRMRNNGASHLVVECRGKDKGDGFIDTVVRVYDKDGKCIFNEMITCPK